MCEEKEIVEERVSLDNLRWLTIAKLWNQVDSFYLEVLSTIQHTAIIRVDFIEALLFRAR